MRLNGFVRRGIMKMVMAPAGVRLPGGEHIPPGVKVGIQAYSVHRGRRHLRRAQTSTMRFASSLRHARTGIAVARREVQLQTSHRRRLCPQAPIFLAFSHGPERLVGSTILTAPFQFSSGM